MSISQINKLFQNKGCNIAVSVILGIATISMLGFGSRGCGGSGAMQNGQNPNSAGRTVVSVGGVDITDDQIRNSYSSRYGEAFSTFPAELRVRYEVDALKGMMTSAMALDLAKKNGVNLSDDVVREAAIKSIRDSIKGQLMNSGQIKPNATDAEVSAELKKVTGKTLDEFLKETEGKLEEQMNDPAAKSMMQAQVAQLLLSEQYAAKNQPTDEQLKASFDSYKLKRITITSAQSGNETPQAFAEKLVGDIKAGKISFEAAMDKFSADPAPKTGKKSEQTVDLPAAALDTEPFGAIGTLKPGEITGALPTPGGVSILKLVSKTSNVPKDFDQRKADLKKSQAEQKGQMMLAKELDRLQAEAKPTWTSEGWHTAYDYFAFEAKTTGQQGPEHEKQVMEFVDRGLKSADQDAIGGEQGVASAYVAFNSVYASAKGAAKTALEPQRIKLLQAFVAKIPQVEQKIQLAEAYLATKDKDNLLSTLIDAAQTNAVHVDDEGEQNWVRIKGAAGRAQRENLLTAQDAAQITTLFTEWTKERDQQKQAQAEAEAQQKKAEAEAKKAEADAKAKAKAIPRPEGNTAFPTPGKPK